VHLLLYVILVLWMGGNMNYHAQAGGVALWPSAKTCRHVSSLGMREPHSAY
jgi:hypothetical protein